MFRKSNKYLVLFAVMALACLAAGIVSAAPVTQSITYQGKLTNVAGNPLTGTYSVTFILYDASTGGNALSTDSHSVTASNGLFTTTITVDSAVVDGRALWLGIKVGSDPEMTPRQEIRPVPYSLSLRAGATIDGSGLTNTRILSVIATGANSKGVYGSSSSDAGVFGNSTTGTGVAGQGYYGVYGWGSPAGIGIVGNSASNIGVEGDSNAGTGVKGWSSGSGGKGVYGVSTGSTGIGVSGESTSNIGVKGLTGGTGTGVYGLNTGSTGIGVRGDSNAGIGMKGWSGSATGTGVYGVSAGSESKGVYGLSDGSTGIGVLGDSNSYIGVKGWSGGTTGTGVVGQGYYGVYGWGNPAGIGIVGNSASNIGVEGDSNAGIGVKGWSGGSGGKGVYGVSAGSTGVGVLGDSASDTGVKGWSGGSGGTGVYGFSTGSSGSGVRGDSNAGIGLKGWTGNANHEWGVYTEDYIYAGGIHAPDVDLAEYMPVAGNLSPGTVLIIGPEGLLQMATTANDTRVVGIISTSPAITLGTKLNGNTGEEIVAISGRVPCKVDAGFGPIHPGDVLTTSQTPGHAMKAVPVNIGGVEIYKPSTVLGKAMGTLESGTGTIEVLVTLQ